MPIDQLAIAGFAVLPLVVWIVQTIKEAFSLDSKYLPPVTLAVALVLVAIILFAPTPIAQLIGTALALAVTANLSISYAKRNTDPQG